MFGNNNGKKTGDEKSLEQRMAAAEKAIKDLIKGIEDENPDISVVGTLYVSEKREIPTRAIRA